MENGIFLFYFGGFPDFAAADVCGALVQWGKKRTRRKTCSISTFSTKNLIWTDIGSSSLLGDLKTIITIY
jgi:hypothetical protein